ncbi:MAG TPA: SDR family oxidoreductase [Noviherbaspirillum sp.]|jgi:short-subunit dehydrogenase|uniref:SDR family oxidoreductase n=1 Tax=Noviherbaspirillum sp. TaxID=1926288 RepID=UPI002F946975
MHFRPKRLSGQVIVITGATSGIGLVTARMAARRGARLVLVSRNKDSLQHLRDECAGNGCEAICVQADVGSEDAMRGVADQAAAHFGGFDTWVNNAGIGIFGRVTEVAAEDRMRLFDTDFWGVVHGSLAALPRLKAGGGTLINVGSAFADRAAPLHGYYSAAKHAVKAFTTALRMEVEQAGAPVAVCLVTPSAIDTMFPVHARNYTDHVPKLPPPQYAPETVAEAILHLAAHPRAELYVGSTGKLLASASYHAPRLVDRIMELVMFRLQQTRTPASRKHEDALFQPMQGLRERSGRTAYVQEHSIYTGIARHRTATTLLLAAAAAALYWKAAGRARRQRPLLQPTKGPALRQPLPQGIQ